MKKTGTLTLALSLIYYGIWLALININSSLAKQILIWWPVIFILFGIEILINCRRTNNARRVGFNVGLIFIILVFFITNLIYQKYNNPFDSVINVKSEFSNYNWDLKGRSIHTIKNISIKNNKFQFKTMNGDLKIKKSDDNNIRLDLTVKVKESSSIKKYDINEENDSNLTKVSIDESYVEGVEGTIFIPDGTDVKFLIDNLKISSRDNIINTIFNIDSENGNFDVSNVAYLGIKAFNGEVDINNIKDTNLKIDNGKFNIKGNMENVDINMKNASVNIDNNTFKNINVNGNNGDVRINTTDNNTDANLTCNIGQCSFNGENINRGNLIRTIGNGSNKIKVNLNMGSIKVNSQE